MWPFLWNILKPTLLKIFDESLNKGLEKYCFNKCCVWKKDSNNILKLSQIHGIPFLELHKHNSKRWTIISLNKISGYFKK